MHAPETMILQQKIIAVPTAVEGRGLQPLSNNTLLQFHHTDHYQPTVPLLHPSCGPPKAPLFHLVLQVSPDEICILDVHPRYPNIAFAAGMSGEAAVTAPQGITAIGWLWQLCRPGNEFCKSDGGYRR